jgi:predicted Zn-dependent protease with MMP-like domain
LDAAWDALERGDWPAVEAFLKRRTPGQAGERLLLEAHWHLAHGDLVGAATRCERARAELGAAHPDGLWTAGEVALYRWEVDAAMEHYAALDALEPSAALSLRRSLCADLVGDDASAAACVERARELDPEGCGDLPRWSTERFEGAVDEAARALPGEFARALDALPVVLDPVPERELARGREAETPPDLLGLYVGPTALERSAEAPDPLPTAIYLFQRNLERACADGDMLVEQVRVTLWHELGHALGFEEDGLDAIGLG